MAFKNALKMIISKFGLMWVILLYLLITGVLVVSLSLPFAVPLVRTFEEAGIGKLIAEFFTSFTSGGGVNAWFDKFYAVILAVKNSILTDKIAAFNTGALVFFVFIFAYRFILGLYEIPLVTVLEGAMSSDARIGFTGRYVSRIGKSCKFVLVKMIYTVLFDFVIFFALYRMFDLFSVPVLKFFAPFIIMAAVLVMLGIRYTLIAMWAPDVVLRERGIFKAFGFSVKCAFKHFGSVFSTFLFAWTLIIAVNMLVGLFTFGAGLILTVPLSLLFVNVLNMTVYYGKNGRRYYTDSATVVTPPIVKEEK